LAAVQSTGAIGGVAGGAALSLWGGPKRRIHGILLGGAGASLFGMLWLGLSNGILLWAIGSFFFAFFEPLLEGSNQAIWQSKVEADVQGRVFAARHLMVQTPYLIGILIAGPIAEYITGIKGLMISVGILNTMIFFAGYISQTLREAEILLPDTSTGE
jgi:membrane protease YdiL (CAAX protease family)